jgi:hypothetical protein
MADVKQGQYGWGVAKNGSGWKCTKKGMTGQKFRGRSLTTNHLGTFQSIPDAQDAWDEAALQLEGSNATRLNRKPADKKQTSTCKTRKLVDRPVLFC